MSDEKKPDYSKLKTPGGVTTTADGDTHPTGLTDESRAAQVAALRDERAAQAARAEALGDDELGGRTAERRVKEIDRALARFGAKQEREPGRAPEKTTPPRKLP